MAKSLLILFLSLVGIFIVDQAIKEFFILKAMEIYALPQEALYHRALDIYETSCINMRLIFNYGVAFSMLSSLEEYLKWLQLVLITGVLALDPLGLVEGEQKRQHTCGWDQINHTFPPARVLNPRKNTRNWDSKEQTPTGRRLPENRANSSNFILISQGSSRKGFISLRFPLVPPRSKEWRRGGFSARCRACHKPEWAE